TILPPDRLLNGIVVSGDELSGGELNVRIAKALGIATIAAEPSASVRAGTIKAAISHQCLGRIDRQPPRLEHTPVPADSPGIAFPAHVACHHGGVIVIPVEVEPVTQPSVG